MKIGIASDFNGLKLKHEVIDCLDVIFRFEVQDFGCKSDDPLDYPKYAYLLAKAVADEKISQGILICIIYVFCIIIIVYSITFTIY